MGKKLPWYAYAVGGVVLTIAALYFWGKYNMKNEDKKTEVVPPITPAPPSSGNKQFAGSVIRYN